MYKKYDIADLVARTRKAQQAWAATPWRKRAAILTTARRVIVQKADIIAETISRCIGKTRTDALSMEVLPSAMAIGYYSRQAGHVLKAQKIRGRNLLLFNKPSIVYRVPYGVIGIISPWNYPFGLPMHEICMALATGNAVLYKVASQTKPVGELIQDVFSASELPPDLLHRVDLPGQEAGDAMIQSGVDKLFFTGSLAAGRELARKGAERLAPMALELGGKDPMIVLEDASLHRAVGGAVWGGFSSCGQSCGAVERIYVMGPVYEDFLRLLRERVKSLRQGEDADYRVDIGPLANQKQKERMRQHLDDALAKGATVTVQSGVDDGLFFPATVLQDVTDDMTVMREETFGPILAVARVDSVEDAVRRANRSQFGLSASVWTRNEKKAEEIAHRLEVGSVMVNDHLMSHAMAEIPWGGFKHSGMGGSRTHGILGLEAMTAPKVIVKESLHRVLPQNMWWFPHSKTLYDSLRAVLFFLYGDSLLKKIRGLCRFLPSYLRAFRRSFPDSG